MDYERVRLVLIGRLRRSGASREDAEDCAQEALLTALTAQKAEQVPDDLQAWTATVARRRLTDLGRRGAVQRRRLVTVDEYDRTACTPEQQVVEQGHARWLAARLSELPTATLQVCELASAGHSRNAIAARMGISVPSADSHLTRARRFLRRQAALVWVVLAGSGACWTRKQTAGAVAVATVAVTVALVPVPSVEGEPDGPARSDGGIVRAPLGSAAGPDRSARPPERGQHRTGTGSGRAAARAPVPSVPQPLPARSRVSAPVPPLPISPRTILTVGVRPERFRHDIAEVVSHGQAAGEDRGSFGPDADVEEVLRDGP